MHKIKMMTKWTIEHNEIYEPIEVRNDSLHICIIAPWSSWSALLSTVFAGASAGAGTVVAGCWPASAAEQHCVQPKSRTTANAMKNFVEDIILISLQNWCESQNVTV